MPVTVVDKNSGQQADVPAQIAYKGIVSGRFEPLESFDYHAQSADGTLSIVSGSELYDVLRGGGRVLDKEMSDTVRIRQENSTMGRQTLGVIESATSGVIPGSRWIERKLGEAAGTDLFSARQQEARRNEGVEEAALIGGLLLGAGEIKAGATGAMAVAKRAGKWAPLGWGASAAKAMGGKGLKQAAARGAIDMGVIGASAELNETALGERELNAESLVGATLGSALLGVGFEGAIGLGAALGRRGMAPARSQIRKIWGVAVDAPAESVSHVPEMWVSGSSALLGGSLEREVRSTAARVTNKNTMAEVSRVISHPKETFEPLARDIRASIADIRAGAKGAQEHLLGRGASRRTRLAIENMSAGERDILEAELISVESNLEGMISRAGRIREIAPSAMSGTISHMERELKRFKNLAGRSEYDLADKVNMLRDVRYQLGDNPPPLTKGPFADEVRQLHSDMYNRINGLFKNRDVMGIAGEVEEKANALTHTYLSEVESGSLQNVVEKIAASENDAQFGQFLSFARKFDAEGTIEKEQLGKLVKMQRGLMELAEESGADAVTMKAIRQGYGGMRKLEETLLEAGRKASILDDFTKIDQAERTSRWMGTGALAGVGAFAGGAIAGPIGGVAGGITGAIVGSMLRPATLLKSIAGIGTKLQERAASRAAGRRSLISRMWGKAKSGAKAAGKVAVAELKVKGGKSGASLYRDLSKSIPALAANPALLERQLAKSTYIMKQVAPSLTERLNGKSVEVVEFLNDRLPATYEPPMGGKVLVDDLEVAKFLRYAEVALEPNNAFRRLANGTLTTEHAEALRTLYPMLFAEAQAQIMENMHPGVPFDVRTELSILFGVPLDSAMDPSRAQLIMAAMTNAPAMPPGPSAPPAHVTLSKKDRVGSEDSRGGRAPGE